MRGFGGQAVRHMLGAIVAALALAALALVVLAWVLSAHPIAAPWLAQRLQRQADAAFGPGALTIGSAAIAWDGFHEGSDDPLAIRLAGVTGHFPGVRRAKAAEIAVRLDLWPLLHGILRPRSARIEHARIVIERPIGTPASPSVPLIPAVLNARPLAAERPWMKSIDFLAIRDSELALGADAAPLLSRLDATLVRDRDDEIELSTEFSTRPAQFAALAPGLAPARRLEAPVSVRAQAVLDAEGRPLAAGIVLRAAAGRLAVAADPVGVQSGMVSADWSRAGGLAGVADVVLRPDQAAPPTHLRAELQARLAAGARIAAHGSVRLDQVRLADLDRLWPEPVARWAREWIIANVTAGTARNLNVGFALSASEDGADATIERLSGTVSGGNVTLHWLRPVPPIEHAAAALRIMGPDRIGIDFAAGTEPLPGASDALRLQSGRIEISGLSAREQVADIRARVAGSVPTALALLSQPRLHLLANHPMPLKGPRGEVVADITAVVPLDARVTLNQIRIAATARLAHVALDDVVAGRNLSDAAIELTANPDGLSFSGAGAVADIPGEFSGTMDFRAGPPEQVLQRIEARADTSVGKLAALGLDTGGLLAGPVQLDAVYEQRRDGDDSVALRAGLDDARMRVDALDWRKPPGMPAWLSGRLSLDRGGRIDRIDKIEGSGTGFALLGQARLAADGATSITLSKLILGATEAQGTIVLGPDGKTVAVSLAGPVLDLGPRLRELRFGPSAPATQTERGAWSIGARFSRAVLAHERAVGDLVLDAGGAGERVQSLRLSADTGEGSPVHASITPEPGGRRVRVEATDGGALLRDLGALGDVEGGALTIAARYDDRKPDHPLSGLAELDNFRLRGTPTVGKALQAASLYGLLQALDGPGMNFSHLVAPFTLANGVITLDRARAFNPSLGLTARGSIDLDNARLRIKGTIIPAYYLNTVLGRLPVIGRLFSPEKAGGLIAADFTASGSLDDPLIRVNPLSALTPGFLRGVFGAAAR